MSASSNTLDLVRKLLAKAERAANDHERDAYNAKAADLIAKYGIDEALLAADRADRSPLTVGDRVITIPGPYIVDKAGLLNAIARSARVKAVLRAQRNGSGEVHLFGYAADLDRVEILFTSLLLQAARGLSTVRPDYWRESVAAYRRSWLAGFTNTIYVRLTEAERKAQAEAASGAPGVALVLRDRNVAVAARVAEVYPHLQAGRRRTLSGSGYGHGQAAGRRANLGGTAVGAGATRAAIG